MNTLPRVLLVTFFYPPTVGGLPQQARLLAGRLARLGVPVSVVTARLAGHKKLEMDEGVPVYRLITFQSEGGYRRRAHPWLFPLFIFLLARRSEHDIYHVHQALHPAALSVLLAKMLGKKTVVKVTGSGATGNMAMLQTWRWLGGWVRALIARADCLISLTDEITSELLENGMDPDKIVRIPNGVDVDAFRLATPKPGVASERTVLGVGRLTWEKGFDVLVEAWSDVTREIDDAHLIILGDGLERGALTTAARKAGVAERITFVGDSAEVPSYLATSKVFVLPSRHEGMANALLEAMAAGRACLASDIQANAAVIQSGVNGLLFKSEDPADLTVQLVRLLQDEAYRTRLGAAAQQTIMSQYSIDAVAQRYLRLYRALIENRPIQAALSEGDLAG